MTHKSFYFNCTDEYVTIIEVLKNSFLDIYIFQIDREMLELGLDLIGSLSELLSKKDKIQELTLIVDEIVVQSQSLSNLPKSLVANLHFTGK